MSNSKFDAWAFDQTVKKGGTIFGCKDKSGVNVGFVNTGTGEYFNLSDEWISVKDRLPSKECEWYLISTKDGEGRKITTMAFFDLVGDDVLWLTHNDKESDSTEWDNVTDWQWLPEPAT